MGLKRRLARKQAGQTLTEMSKATVQLSELNGHLQNLSEVSQKLTETSKILDALTDDYQTLADELEFTQFVLRRVTGLTPEQEAEYRSELAKARE